MLPALVGCRATKEVDCRKPPLKLREIWAIRTSLQMSSIMQFVEQSGKFGTQWESIRWHRYCTIDAPIQAHGRCVIGAHTVFSSGVVREPTGLSVDTYLPEGAANRAVDCLLCQFVIKEGGAEDFSTVTRSMTSPGELCRSSRNS